MGGEEVSFSQIFVSLSQGSEFLLLPSGRYFPLKQEKLLQLKRLMDEAKELEDKESQSIRISRFQIGFWEELEQMGVVKKQAETWQKTVQELKGLSQIVSLEPPKGFKGQLRPYQKEGWTWLEFLRRCRLGGVLADDMGLGKTVQAICLFAAFNKAEREGKPFLVIAPTSVVENWDGELERFAPRLKRIILRRGDRSLGYKEVNKADVVVTSYHLILRDFEKLKDLAFDAIILDEAQMVKNHQSKVYSQIKRLNGKVKIALTGTPLENSLVELWAILSITCPGIFPSIKGFHENYRVPIERNQDKEKLERLRRRIRPFILRRKKESVEKELPQKTVQTLLLTMNEEHKRIYDRHLVRERQRVLGLLESGGFKDHRFEILKSLTKMRRLCLHPGLIDEEYSHAPATKIEALSEQIELLAKENHRMLIFSQFTSFLAIVKETLSQKSLDYLYLDGQTKNRGGLVKKFQTGDAPIFLISLKAGGFGLNLTAADYCFLLDPWWNPAVEKQAVDRAHRIGQTKPVFVYKFILKDSIEENVLKLQEKKEKLFKNVLEDGDVFGSMVSEDDVRQIFS